MYVDNGKGSLGPSVKMMTRHQLYNSKSILSKTPNSSNQTVILLFTSCRVLLSTVIYPNRVLPYVRPNLCVKLLPALNGLLVSSRLFVFTVDSTPLDKSQISFLRSILRMKHNTEYTWYRRTRYSIQLIAPHKHTW